MLLADWVQRNALVEGAAGPEFSRGFSHPSLDVPQRVQIYVANDDHENNRVRRSSPC